jgi:23S rRNA pseudouridine1911/1915/1917 synthase
MIEDLDDIELLEDDLEVEEPVVTDGQLYEHMRMEVDHGQVPVRIDKYMA